MFVLNRSEVGDRDKDRDKVRGKVKVNALRDSSLMERISLLSEDPKLSGLLIILVALQ